MEETIQLLSAGDFREDRDKRFYENIMNEVKDIINEAEVYRNQFTDLNSDPVYDHFDLQVKKHTVHIQTLDDFLADQFWQAVCYVLRKLNFAIFPIQRENDVFLVIDWENSQASLELRCREELRQKKEQFLATQEVNVRFVPIRVEPDCKLYPEREKVNLDSVKSLEKMFSSPTKYDKAISDALSFGSENTKRIAKQFNNLYDRLNELTEIVQMFEEKERIAKQALIVKRFDNTYAPFDFSIIPTGILKLIDQALKDREQELEKQQEEKLEQEAQEEQEIVKDKAKKPKEESTKDEVKQGETKKQEVNQTNNPSKLNQEEVEIALKVYKALKPLLDNPKTEDAPLPSYELVNQESEDEELFRPSDNSNNKNNTNKNSSNKKD